MADGRKSGPAAVGSTLACVNQIEGIVRVQFSDSLFDSWRCDRMLDQDLKGDHSSAVGLDNVRLLLVHDRGLGKFSIDGQGTRATEGIEVAQMMRNITVP